MNWEKQGHFIAASVAAGEGEESKSGIHRLLDLLWIQMVLGDGKAGKPFNILSLPDIWVVLPSDEGNRKGPIYHLFYFFFLFTFLLKTH